MSLLPSTWSLSAVGDDSSLRLWDDTNESNMSNSTPHYQEDDVKWCYYEHHVEVCVRLSVMLFLTLITAIIIFLRLVQYHWYRSNNYSQYIIYYSGLLLCILSLFHWSYFSSAAIDFFLTFIVVFQMLVIAQFFCSWAARILRYERVFQIIIYVVLFVLLVYFVAVTAWAIVRLQNDKQECIQPQWLLFSSSQLLVVQLFTAAVIFISNKLTHTTTAHSNKLSQKVQLWGLAIVYQLVTAVTFTYDLSLLITRKKDNDCQTFLTSNNAAIVIIYILHGGIKYLVPQWCIVLLFSPLKNTRMKDEVDSLSWAEKPNYQSTFYRRNSQDSSSESDYLLPRPLRSVNSTSSSSSLHPPAPAAAAGPSSYGTAILPRQLSVHSPYGNSPWLKTQPGQTFPTQQALRHNS